METGIVSSAPKRYCERVIQEHDLWVDHLIAAHSSRRPKPEPDGVLAMLDKMGLGHSPETVALVGDSQRDMLAAKSAGVWRYAAMWGGSACDADAGNVDQVCASPQDLMYELLHEISPE